jgi:hypothetical protein
MSKNKVRITHDVYIQEPQGGRGLFQGIAAYHPKHGLVYITDGYFMIDGRMSNHFRWQRIKKNGTLGKRIYFGYGTEFGNVTA